MITLAPRLRIPSIVIGVCAFVLVLAPGAEAVETVECVAFPSPPTECTNTWAAADLQDAIDAVESDGDADVVRVAQGMFAGPFSFSSTDGDELVGVGMDVTTLRLATASGHPTIDMEGAASKRIRVRDLTLARSSGTTGSAALNAENVVLDHVVLRAVFAPGVAGRAAMVEDVSIADSRIEVGGSQARGVYSSSGVATLDRTSVIPLGIDVFGGVSRSGEGAMVLSRSMIGDNKGVNSFEQAAVADSGTMVVQDSLIDMGARTSAYGVFVANDNAGSLPLTMVVVRSTIVGSGTGQRGIVGQSDSAMEALTFVVDSTVVNLAGSNPIDIMCNVGASGLLNVFALAHSAFDQPLFELDKQCTPALAASNIDTQAIPAGSLFIGPAEHDWRPRYGSVLVDHGNPSATGLSTDVGGQPRLRDGDGAGTPAEVVDIGAWELPRYLPQVTASASPAVVTAGQLVSFSGTATDPLDDEPASITSWSFGDGASAAAPAPTHAYAEAGTYTAIATGTDVSGATATASVQVTVLPAAQQPGGTRPGDTTRPVLKLQGLPKRVPFLRSSGRFKAAGAKTRRAVRVTLSERSAVTVRLAWRVGKRYVSLPGHQALTLPRGVTRIAWGGTWAGRLRPTGTYRVTMTPKDAAGNVGNTRVVVVSLARRARSPR